MVVGSYVVDKIARLTENRMWQVVDSGVLSPFDLVTSLFYTCIISFLQKKKKRFFITPSNPNCYSYSLLFSLDGGHSKL